MWQGGTKMTSLNVTDVIKELDISKSYLYKLTQTSHLNKCPYTLKIQ